MKNTINKLPSFEGTHGPLQMVANDLPPPEQLIFKNSGSKVTILLSPTTVSYFKQKADQLGSSYQRMIRNLLDQYVAKQTRKITQD